MGTQTMDMIISYRVAEFISASFAIKKWSVEIHTMDVFASYRVAEFISISFAIKKMVCGDTDHGCICKLSSC